MQSRSTSLTAGLNTLEKHMESYRLELIPDPRDLPSKHAEVVLPPKCRFLRGRIAAAARRATRAGPGGRSLTSASSRRRAGPRRNHRQQPNSCATANMLRATGGHEVDLLQMDTFTCRVKLKCGLPPTDL